MCDEYEDERLWAVWRRLETQEELKRQKDEPEGLEVPVIFSLPDPADPRKARPKPLTH